MKRILNIITSVLVSIAIQAQEKPNDYIPFVELGKLWNVVSTDANSNYACSFESYDMYEEVERHGRTYTHACILNEVLGTSEEVGLFREENRRVYMYDETAGRDILLYDFSLTEGDTFTYEFDVDQPENCKVLKQGWLEDGPNIVSSCVPNSEGSLDITYRRLRTWTIGRDNGSGEYREAVTWVECIGAIENMFSLYSGRKRSCLAFVKRTDNETYYGTNEYLPFSFCNIFNVYGQKHGCNLPTGAEDYSGDDGHHKLIYELEGDRLHVYGKVYTQCGPNNYAFFHEEKTTDPLVQRIKFVIQAVKPIENRMALHTTDFYVPGFDPNMNYIIQDNQGGEHPVVNKTSQDNFRPFVEDGKVWKVGGRGSGNPVHWVEYYYFDGDTIIGGRTCKQMMRQRYVTPDFPEYSVISRWPSLSYVGAWYEEDKKVYFSNAANKQFELMYDFSLNTNDTLWLKGYPYVVGPKQTEGIKGFKGFYRDVMMCEDGESIYNTTWLEGVGNIDGPTYSVFYGKDAPVLFLMSCTVGDEVIYLNDDYEDGATPDVMGARKDRFDFTHTIKPKPKTPIKREKSNSLYGEYNEQQLCVNLAPIDDAYLVSITDESGKTVYEKAVNASIIVALNIDISDYADGHYTVILENSREIFTGEFAVKTTGIVAVRTDRTESREGVYNLQGQRISSLKKGLNIVNGRLVMIK